MKSVNALIKVGGILLFFLHSIVYGQQIDSMLVSPSSTVGVNDTVKIFMYSTFSSGGCAGTANYSKTGFNIMANALHCQGALTVICTDIDTILINPPHVKGTYRVSFVLNSGFGGPPCTPGFVPNDYDTVYFTVGANLPPAISTISDDTTCKNTSLGPLAFTVNDENIGSLVITAYSDNQALVANNNINISGTGANRMVSVTPSSNQLGSANIKIVVTDNQNMKDSVEFTVYVEDCTVGISKAQYTGIEVFPNPSKGEVTIYLGSTYSQVELSLNDLSGLLLHKWFYNKVEEIDLHIKEASGVYFLRISTEKGETVYRLVLE